MAVVTTKRKDSKYSHLKRVYSDDNVRVKVDKSEPVDVVQVKRPELKLERKDIIKNVFVIVILGALSVSGYLISRFIK